MRFPSAVLATGALLALAPGAAAETVTVGSGDFRAVVETDPWSLSFVDADGRQVVRESEAMRLGYRTTTGWAGASGPATVVSQGSGEAVFEVSTAVSTPVAPLPAGRLRVTVRDQGFGIVGIEAEPLSSEARSALGIGFRSRDDERLWGLGERPERVNQNVSSRVETYVADGPYYPDAERQILAAFVPPAGYRARDDATYFPIPWVLSSRGFGVLVDNTETAYHDFTTASAWSVEVTSEPDDPGASQTAPSKLNLRLFGGGQPAKVLRRFTTQVGRQPEPPAPWVWGSWFQPGGSLEEQLAQIDKLRAADAPLSVAQTYLHYLPCGAQVGGTDNERKRVQAVHARGAAITTYFNPMICESYQPAFAEAAAAGALAKRSDGSPYTYSYSSSPTSRFDVGQFDFSAEAGQSFYKSLLAEAVADGHDGWMEDFGEYTPLDSHYANGMTGVQMHNLYPTQYHCTAYDFVRKQKRPIVRFQRSGFTGSARCAQVVWSGDPTVGWDFDGLESQIKAGLSMGFSGVSTWGSDIGGFFAIGERALSDELLKRWVQFGAVSPVMRMQRNGVAFPEKERPQVEDDDQIGNWRRYAKLHTRLYPYLQAADRVYRRTGLPIMRHLSLVFQDDSRSEKREDEYMFGPDLLAAPVFTPGATTRDVYLPPGNWVDFWRALRYRQKQGDLRLGQPGVLAGGAEYTRPAPLDELPLFVRLGSVLPLLPADVDTLADYGPGKGVVPLKKRRGKLDLIAFPRGRWSGTFFKGERIISRERTNGWDLQIKGKRRRTYTMQAWLGALRDPFHPCLVGFIKDFGDMQDMRYSRKTKVLRVTFTTRSATLKVRPC